MSTAYYKFTGKCKWAKLAEPDDFKGQKKYKINLYLDKAGLRQLNESEARLQVRTDDDGKYVTFSRAETKLIKEETKEQGPPWVLQVVDGEEVDFDDPRRIGNGSTVTVKIAVYDTRMGKGHTLEAVRVDELVEYNPEQNTNNDSEARKF
jgi:hypothetical protein